MKSELTSLDLHYLTKEFQEIIGGKIDKAFQSDTSFMLQLHVPGKGKRYLRIILPSIIYVSESKEDIEESGKFGLSIRKHISNSRIRSINQLESERILDIRLESKERMLHLYIELFRPGNIILAGEDKKIVMASTYKGFGSRVIRPGGIYEYPKREYNFLNLKEADLKKLTDESKKSSVVITLATDLGLGGEASEELCSIAKIDKKKQSLDEKELKRLYAAIIWLKDRDMKLNRSLDEHFTVKTRQDKQEIQLSKYDKKRLQLLGIIRQQEAMINGLEVSAEANQRKGEYIYENYQKIDTLLKEIKEYRKTKSWKEIKEILPIEVNEKEKRIVGDI